MNNFQSFSPTQSKTHFPFNIYSADVVEPLPYYYKDIGDPLTHFEFDMNRVPRHPNSRIPGRWGWNTGHPNGYGTGNFQFHKNCPNSCLTDWEQNPKGMVSKKTIETYNYYACLPFYCKNSTFADLKY